MVRLSNDARRLTVVYAAIGLMAPIVILGCADVLRLYLTGFPEADVEQDIARFPRVAVPVAATCSIVLAIAGFAVAAVPSLSRLCVTALVVGASIIAAGLYEFLRDPSPDDEFVRGGLAVVGAVCMYLGLRRHAGEDLHHPPAGTATK